MKRTENFSVAFDNAWLDEWMRLGSSAALKVALVIARAHAEKGVATKSDLVLDISRSTLTSAIETLLNCGLIERANDGYTVPSSYNAPYLVFETRRPIPRSLRESIYRRDGHQCRYCGSDDRLTLDHVLPWSRGGRDDTDNLVTACWSCNNWKRAKTPEEAGMILTPPMGVN